MTKRKNTERALVTSIVAMMLCMAMLATTTFAWFVDSATSLGNNIISGNLEVDLLLADETTGEYESIKASKKPIFGEGDAAQNKNAETLWEPGKTQVAYLKVVNKGNLALKYNVALVTYAAQIETAVSKLYEVMECAVVDEASWTNKVGSWDAVKENNEVVAGKSGLQIVKKGEHIVNPGEESYFAFVLHMKEDAGMEYKNSRAGFDLTVIAAQATVEEDSFDNLYDANAIYPSIPGIINVEIKDCNGYFIVCDGSNNYFTKAGSFYVDSEVWDEGIYLPLAMTGTGYRVMGWQVDEENGSIRKDTVSPLALNGIDGENMSSMTRVFVEEDGMIYAGDDNGNNKKLLGQIPVAVFANPAGLHYVGNGLYETTLTSGEFDGIGCDITGYDFYYDEELEEWVSIGGYMKATVMEYSWPLSE